MSPPELSGIHELEFRCLTWLFLSLKQGFPYCTLLNLVEIEIVPCVPLAGIQMRYKFSSNVLKQE